MSEWFKNWQHIGVFAMAKFIGNVFAISILRLLVSGANLPEKQKNLFLRFTGIMIFLNILGCYRNSFTLWKYAGLMSYLWLGQDLAQLLYTFAFYWMVKNSDDISPKAFKTLFYFGLLFILLNGYSFMVNFSYFAEEGLFIFVFWFVNNLGMIAYGALNNYLIHFKKAIFYGQKEKTGIQTHPQ